MSRLGAEIEEQREAIEQAMEAQAPLSHEGDTLVVSWDGVMTPLREATKVAWREAGVATVSIYGQAEDGHEKLDTRYLARMPEKGMKTLQEQAVEQVVRAKRGRVFREFAVVCDGKDTIWDAAAAHPSTDLTPDAVRRDFTGQILIGRDEVWAAAKIRLIPAVGVQLPTQHRLAASEPAIAIRRPAGLVQSRGAALPVPALAAAHGAICGLRQNQVSPLRARELDSTETAGIRRDPNAVDMRCAQAFILPAGGFESVRCRSAIGSPASLRARSYPQESAHHYRKKL